MQNTNRNPAIRLRDKEHIKYLLDNVNIRKIYRMRN